MRYSSSRKLGVGSCILYSAGEAPLKSCIVLSFANAVTNLLAFSDYLDSAISAWGTKNF